MEARIIGCEDELALLVQRPDAEEWSNLGVGQVAATVLRRYMPTERSPRNGSATAHFYENGMRIYIDVGDHLEITTAESADLDDVVAGNLAGLLMMHAGFKRAYNDEAIPRYTLFNRVVSDISSWGFHENYQADRRIAPGDGTGELDGRRLHALQAFLAVRPLMSGAGSMYGGTFQLAQKAARVHEGIHYSTTMAKPLINTRDEPHADPKKYARLHIPCGDPTSPHVLRRTLGMTSLVIRMIEEGRVNRDDFRGTHWGNVARLVSADVAMDQKFNLHGKQVTALDLHEFFLEEGYKMADRGVLPQELESLDATGAVYDTLRNIQRDSRRYERDPIAAEQVRLLGFMALAEDDLVDWAKRHVYLHSIQNKGYYTWLEAQQSDVIVGDRDPNFDIVSQNGNAGIFWKRTTTPAARQAAPAERIKERVTVPPPGRAQDRQRFMREFGHLRNAHVDWGMLGYQTPFAGSVVLRLSEPSQCSPHYKEFVAKIAEQEEMSAACAELDSRPQPGEGLPPVIRL